MAKVLVIILLCFVSSAWATPPTIEPIDIVFERFCTQYPTKSDALVKEIERLITTGTCDLKAQWVPVHRYFRNIEKDDIPGLRRAIAQGDKAQIQQWSHRLAVDLQGYRRSLDRLIIMSSARGPSLNQVLLPFWHDDDYYSWRFSAEE